MKTVHELSSDELKAGIKMLFASNNLPLTDLDSFTVDANGVVTIVCESVLVLPTVTATLTARPAPTATPTPATPVPPTAAPISTLSAIPSATIPQTPGHFVVVEPPLSCTGKATIFGLNYGGTIDAADNGIGFFTDPSTGRAYDTHNRTLAGCSLPREVLLSTFLKIDSWQTDGIDSVWSHNASMLRQWVNGNKPLLTIDSGGLSVENVPLVDAGPSASTGNCLDLTYATAHALKTNGNALATYAIMVAGKPVLIAGWDWKTGRVG